MADILGLPSGEEIRELAEAMVRLTAAMEAMLVKLDEIQQQNREIFNLRHESDPLN
jgi:hypothetical protein